MKKIIKWVMFVITTICTIFLGYTLTSFSEKNRVFDSFNNTNSIVLENNNLYAYLTKDGKTINAIKMKDHFQQKKINNETKEMILNTNISINDNQDWILQFKNHNEIKFVSNDVNNPNVKTILMDKRGLIITYDKKNIIQVQMDGDYHNKERIIVVDNDGIFNNAPLKTHTGIMRQQNKIPQLLGENKYIALINDAQKVGIYLTNESNLIVGKAYGDITNQKRSLTINLYDSHCFSILFLPMQDQILKDFNLYNKPNGIFSFISIPLLNFLNILCIKFNSLNGFILFCFSLSAMFLPVIILEKKKNLKSKLSTGIIFFCNIFRIILFQQVASHVIPNCFALYNTHFLWVSNIANIEQISLLTLCDLIPFRFIPQIGIMALLTSLQFTYFLMKKQTQSKNMLFVMVLMISIFAGKSCVATILYTNIQFLFQISASNIIEKIFPQKKINYVY